jgi:hypothetical protein
VGPAALALTTWLPGVLAIPRVLGDALCGNYLETFAADLRELPHLRVATTEAGNLPYWIDADVLDLVGLNSRETARVPPSRKLLESFAPDLVLLHPAGGLDLAKIAARHPEVGRSIVRFDPPYADCILPERARFLAQSLPRYLYLHAENAKVAPIVTLGFLEDRADAYDVYLVPARHVGGLHVVALRRRWAERDRVLAWLEAAERETSHASYLATVGRARRLE